MRARRLTQNPLLNEGDYRGTPVGGGCMVPKRAAVCQCVERFRDPMRGWCRFCGGTLMRPLLVGEANPYGVDPRMALFPLPTNAAGGRLCRILGLGPRTYMRTFDRVNLCAGKWNTVEARERALDIEQWRGPGAVLVLLGAKVCGAFGVPFEPFTRDVRRIVLPHPSGLCRLWNEPGANERARELLAAEVGPCPAK